MGVLEIATQGFSLKATAALLGQSEDQVALESPEDWYVGREEGSGMRLSGHSKIALTLRIQRKNVPVAKKP
jgi:hypothetical protein